MKNEFMTSNENILYTLNKTMQDDNSLANCLLLHCKKSLLQYINMAVRIVLQP